MQSAIEQFQSNMVRVRGLGGLHAAMAGLLAPIVDRSDILRAQCVMTVSALDHYVHEVVRLGMLEVFDGTRQPTSAYLKFRVSMSCVSTANIVRNQLEADIREQHSFLSFQRPDKVADALRLICDKPLWESVSQVVGADAKTLKTKLTLIVDRRNKIAHEADLDPTFPNTRWPIDEADLSEVVSTIDTIVNAIHVTVT